MPVKSLIYRLLLAILMFTVCRILFFSINFNYFSSYSPSLIFKAFETGLRFDLSSVIYVNIIFILLSINHFDITNKIWYQRLLFWVFLVFNSFALLLEIIDFEYFKYAQKRSGINEFNLIGDMIRLLPAIFKDYWYLFLLLPFFIYLVAKAYRFRSSDLAYQNSKWYLIVGKYALVLAIVVIGARGGLQLRPISPSTAGEVMKDVRLIPLATNTTITLIYSLQQKAITQKHYFTDNQLDSLFTLRVLPDTTEKFNPKNVVILIMESLGKEYIGKSGKKASNTPFLDSLMNHCIYCEASYANAQRSAQGIVSISTGIPDLMEEPLHFSPYQTNKVEGLASCLKTKGYTTAFFHGSNPGSMDFEKFASVTGFDYFYDKRAFNNEKLYDGNWGIWDIPFFEWTVNKISSYKQPFFSMAFSITSHHPFKVEKWFEKLHQNVPPLPRAIRYSDEALRRFFVKAAKTDWYKNTLFIITGDHAGKAIKREYKTKEGLFKVPILFFSPDTQVFKSLSIAKNPIPDIMQQVDIMPSILDILHYDKTFYSFGRTIFTKSPYRYTFQYSNGIYQIIDKTYILLYDGNSLVGLYNHINDPLLKHNIAKQNTRIKLGMLNKLKAVIQRYNKAMAMNELCN